MTHLSCLLLLIQFRYLFVCSFFFILLSLFHLYSYSSQSRYSLVNVVLTFNDSLILIAPSAPMLLSVHLFIHYPFFLFILSSFSQIKLRYVQGATGITLSIFFHSSSVIDQRHSPHSASFFSLLFLQTSYFHPSASSSFPSFLHKNLSNLIPLFL